MVRLALARPRQRRVRLALDAGGPEQRRPRHGAGAVADALGAGVVVEEVQGHAATVDEDRAELGRGGGDEHVSGEAGTAVPLRPVQR